MREHEPPTILLFPDPDSGLRSGTGSPPKLIAFSFSDNQCGIVSIQSRCSDRDEIRRRLAMSADDDFYYGASLGGSGEFEFPMQRRCPQSSFHVGGRSMHSSTSLQVCYVNDVAADLDRDFLTTVPPAASTPSTAAATQRPHPKPDVIPKSISEVINLWLPYLQ